MRWRTALATVLLVGACSGPSTASRSVAVFEKSEGSLHGTDVSDVIRRPDLLGTTAGGLPFALGRSPEVTSVFFGYTRCPDVCPTTMADLASAVRRLQPEVKARVHVVFVTQDLRNDTPEVLSRWLGRFDASFIGVRPASAASNAQVLSALKASSTELAPAGSKRSVEHTGSVYVFVGARVIVYTGGTTPTEYAQDLTALAR